MALNKGKGFELRFREDWKKSFPSSFCYRLPDQQSYYYGSHNPCDFICFNDGILYLLECKTHKGASIPFECISQYESLKSYQGKPGIRAGVIVWLNEKDLVFYVSIKTLIQMKKDGKKSVGLKAIEDKKYDIRIIPSVKLRTFMESDYKCLVDLQEGD